MKIGFVGLGNMGFPMAGHLLRAGHDVYAKNRSAAKEERFVAQGGKSGLSLQEMASTLDVVITCLPMPADVEQVYSGADGLLKAPDIRATFIDCSTVSPALSRQLFEAATEAGADFIDAPVSGGTVGAEAATLTVMAGGKREVFARVLPVLSCMGQKIDYVGKAGSGSAVKLINQLMVGIHSQAVAEAFALARAAELDHDQLFDILSNSFAQSKMLERHYSQFITKDHFTPGFALKLLSKDMNLANEMAKQSDVRLVVGARVNAWIKRAVTGSYGDLDMSALYKVQQDADEHGPRKTFAVFLRMRDAELSQRYRAEHLRFLDERRAAGQLFANGRFTDGAGGLVVYRTSSYEETETLVQQDPYIRLGARTYDIHEWDIVPAEE